MHTTKTEISSVSALRAWKNSYNTLTTTALNRTLDACAARSFKLATDKIGKNTLEVLAQAYKTDHKGRRNHSYSTIRFELAVAAKLDDLAKQGIEPNGYVAKTRIVGAYYTACTTARTLCRVNGELVDQNDNYRVFQLDTIAPSAFGQLVICDNLLVAALAEIGLGRFTW